MVLDGDGRRGDRHPYRAGSTATVTVKTAGTCGGKHLLVQETLPFDPDGGLGALPVLPGRQFDRLKRRRIGGQQENLGVLGRVGPLVSQDDRVGEELAGRDRDGRPVRQDEQVRAFRRPGQDAGLEGSRPRSRSR